MWHGRLHGKGEEKIGPEKRGDWGGGGKGR